jgi:hypothetical protein
VGERATRGAPRPQQQEEDVMTGRGHGGQDTADALHMSIHFSRWFVPLGWVTGIWPRHCYLTVDAEAVTVAMGWAFRGRVPRRAVASAEATHVGPWAGIGVHGWRGTWVVNGALHQMVEIRLSTPVRARAVGVPVRLRRLFVSVDDPGALIRALR